jgi:SAM-dependent methyltransferase
MTSLDAPSTDPRDEHPDAYGAHGLGLIDRAGIRLRTRAVRRHVRRENPRHVLDLGCGYQATFLRSLRDVVPEGVGVDLEVDPQLKELPGLSFVTEPIEDALNGFDDGSFDMVTILSVLEHLPDPQLVLDGIHRVLRPGGTAFIHVPTWLGKPILEWLAFKRGIGTASINDHRMYYAVSDMWPPLIRAGFVPQNVKLRYHTAGCALTATAVRAKA